MCGVVEEREHSYILDAGSRIKDSLIGVVGGMLYSSQAIGTNKPILALTLDEEENRLKISGRGTRPLVRKGLHLGEAMKEAAQAYGGEGGGHNIAAGAHIPPEKKEEFLKQIDMIIGRQLMSSS